MTAATLTADTATTAPVRFEVTNRTHRITVELDTEFPDPRGFPVGNAREYGGPRGVLDLAQEAVCALADVHALDQRVTAVDVWWDMGAGCTHWYPCGDRCPVDFHPCECTPGARITTPLTINGSNFVFWVEPLDGAA